MAVVIPYVKQGAPFIDHASDPAATFAAADANAIDDGISDAHYMPAVRAGRAAVLAVVTSTWTLVPWTNETFDHAGNVASTMHDNSTNPARLIARHAGRYAWHTTHVWAANATGARLCYVQKNSEALPATINTGVVQGGYFCQSGSSVTAVLSSSGIADLAVNDYLACVVWQNIGSNLDIQTDSHFEMVRVG